MKVEREAQEYADTVGVKIFTADIIYHLFDKFMKHRQVSVVWVPVQSVERRHTADMGCTGIWACKESSTSYFRLLFIFSLLGNRLGVWIYVNQWTVEMKHSYAKCVCEFSEGVCVHCSCTHGE